MEFIKKASLNKELGYKNTIKNLLELLKSFNINGSTSESLLEDLKNSKNLESSQVIQEELSELFNEIWKTHRDGKSKALEKEKSESKKYKQKKRSLSALDGANNYNSEVKTEGNIISNKLQRGR